MNIFTVALFGHRQLSYWHPVEQKLKEIITELLFQKEYIDFLVGRNGDFDQMASSVIRTLKQTFRDDNSSLSLILPYVTAEYRCHRNSFELYYDEIMICEDSATCHFKKAIELRNRYMIDQADLVPVFVERNYGGAYQALCYAKKRNKKVINIADVMISSTNPD